jgi:hypothetical protein
MKDDATHVEVPRAEGAGAVVAQLSRPLSQNFAFPGILPLLSTPLLSGEPVIARLDGFMLTC